MSRSGTPEGAVYGEAADRRLSGHPPPEDRLPCHLGEYRLSAVDTGAGVRGRGPTEERAAQAYVERPAELVVIYRDIYRVPHVHGGTDEAAVFGQRPLKSLYGH